MFFATSLSKEEVQISNQLAFFSRSASPHLNVRGRNLTGQRCTGPSDAAVVNFFTVILLLYLWNSTRPST